MNRTIAPALPHRRLARLGALVVAGALALSACGQSSPTATPAAPTENGAPSTVPAAAVADATVVKTAESPLGQILTGAGGMTLYGFTNDTAATSTCFGTCATAWPPLIVGEDWQVAPGLDSGVFSTIIRTGGQRQLVAGKWPLYYYASDAKPGDETGQGSGDVWFVVGTDAKLIKDPAPAPAPATPAGGPAAAAKVKTASTSIGTVLVDGAGRTLYGFTKDEAGTPTCVDKCATAWPPLLVDGDSLPAGLDPAVYSVITRPGGKKQLKAGKWPLYFFSGDDKAGDVAGQGSGGVWFVVSPDGKLIKTGSGAAPAATPVPPTTKAPSSGSGY